MWSTETGTKESYAEFIETVKDEIQAAAAGTYQAWGAEIDSDTDLISATGMEMGFAFEKMACGFFSKGEPTGTWAKDIANKFEQKYWTMLENKY